MPDSTPQKVTRNRIVDYKPYGNPNSDVTPAIIVKVRDAEKGIVDLHVFVEGGVQPSVNRGDREGQWQWPQTA